MQKIKVANDLGYSYVKIRLNDESFIQPSVIAEITNETNPVQFLDQDQQDLYMKEFMDHLDVSVKSPAVEDNNRYLVGTSADTSSLATTQFDIDDSEGKSNTDLSMIITLGFIAGKAVKDYYEDKQELPKSIQTNATMATALPVAEGKGVGTTNKYRDRFMSTPHKVVINNFANPITVTIKFNQVYVGLEGETAQFYIMNSDQQLRDSIEQQISEDYPELSNEVSVEDLIHSPNVMGIDIGGGTVDISSVMNGRANANASDSMPQGYGNVLVDALSVLQAENLKFKNHVALQDFLRSNPSPLKKARYNRVKEIVSDVAKPFIHNIVSNAGHIMSKSEPDVIFIYGGGASALSDSSLREEMEDKCKRHDSLATIPVIWINEKYAQLLNEDGLALIADQLSEEK